MGQTVLAVTLEGR